MDLDFGAKMILLCLFAAAMLCAIIPHEVAHGYAALKMGDPSAKIAGRLSLNPAVHIDPLGLLSFCIMGFGWAKPVPVNPFNYKNFRRGNFWVSIAGVLTNLGLAIILSFPLFFIDKFGDMNNMGIFMLYWFLFLCVILNITLMLFNLIPVYPLDGFNMLVSFTKPNNRYMQFVQQNSMWVILVVIAIVYFTGVISILQNFVLQGLSWLWGLIFAWL
jgi:Zn-dependent protease